MFSQTDQEFLERLKYLNTGAGKLFIVVPSSATWLSELVSQSFPGRVVSSLNTAISQCASGRGDTILMLPGDHTEGSPSSGENSATIDKDGIMLMGMGPNRTTYTSSDSRNAIAVNADGVTIKGIGLDTAAVDDAGIYVTGGDGLLIENCWMSETAPLGYGIQFDLSGDTVVTNVTVKGCRFVNCANGIFVDSTENGAVAGLTVEGCDFVGSGTAAISDAGSDGDPCDGVLIKGCSFVDNTKDIDFDAVANKGMITQCNFDADENTAANIGDLDDATLFVSNHTEDGPTTGRPA